MLTADAIEGYKQYTERIIGYARYRINSTWYRAEIERDERMADGRVAIYVDIAPEVETAVTLTGVELYDKDGKLWASKSENIEIKDVQEGVYYRFTFDLHEEEAES